MVELQYIPEAGDGARVVETPDSARIVPPTMPPRVRFYDGPMPDRIAGWVMVGIVTWLCWLVVMGVHLGAQRWRTKPPVDVVDYIIFGVLTLGILGLMALAASMVVLVVMEATPRRCEILVHVTGMAIRRFHGRWRKVTIEKGALRTIVISGRRMASTAIRIGAPVLPRLSVLCDGEPALVQIGQYEHALAQDIAQAIVEQHARLGLPLPRILDAAGVEAVTSDPPGEPRLYRLERSAAELRIVALGLQFVPALMAQARMICLLWCIPAALAWMAWKLNPALWKVVLLFSIYVAIGHLGLLYQRLVACRSRQYLISLPSADQLTVVTQSRIGTSRKQIRRDTIAAIRLACGPGCDRFLAIVRKDGTSRPLACRTIDAAWELAAILRRELGVPAVTAQEHAAGVFALPPAPRVLWASLTSSAADESTEGIEPNAHQIKVHVGSDRVIIEQPARGLRRESTTIGVFATVLILGSIAAAWLVPPALAGAEDRRVALSVSLLALGLGMVLMLAVVVDVMASFRFELTARHLTMQRTLPWGTRRSSWELHQIVGIRLEGTALVLDDWSGTARPLLQIANNQSLRYAAALLRKHLAQMRAANWAGVAEP